jgi:hypothetical protein
MMIAFVAAIYWQQVHKEYSLWADDREDKDLPCIHYKEWVNAQCRANCFVLSKDRPWTIKNYVAAILKRAFL